MTSTPDTQTQIAQTLGMDASSHQKKTRKKRILAVITVVLLCLIVGWTWKGHGNGQAMQYETQTIETGDLTILVTATGNLEPTVDVNVGCEVSGTLDSVEVDYNDKVKVGQILARLDTTKLEAEVTQSAAALQAAKAQVLQAQATIKETQSKLKQLQKVRELSQNRVPSQVEMDAAEADYARAQADLASAEASVAQAQATLEYDKTDLGKAIIKSPINGIVLTRKVEAGQTVAASMEAPVLFTLAEDLTQMELQVDVDEADIGQVKEGQEAVFTVDAYPNRPFQAKIIQTRYGSATVDGVVTYKTILAVDNSDLVLRPGMTATADITVQQIQNAMLVPNAALRFVPPTEDKEGEDSSRGLVGMLMPGPPNQNDDEQEDVDITQKQQTLWVLQDGQVVGIPVTIGSSDGIQTQILSGDIQPGMQVITDTLTGGR